MEIEFGFRKEKSSLFGEIKRPVARVILINKEIKIPEIFYVDSGADITLIPRSVGELLQLEDPEGLSGADRNLPRTKGRSF